MLGARYSAQNGLSARFKVKIEGLENYCATCLLLDIMYHLVPYRISFRVKQPKQNLEHKLADLKRAGELHAGKSRNPASHWVKADEQFEWLAPEIDLSWESFLYPDSPLLQLILRPKMWLRNILRVELVVLLALLVGLAHQQLFIPLIVVLGVVFTNHLFLYLIMRNRFRATADWLQRQLEG